MNVVEIDAASNNGVDSIREIREQVQYPPTEGKYRVYIIDEVHMLSTGAFNALLKTLEEPPSYVIFILATTEVHKIPITVLSRCQRYDFKRISLDTLTGRLKELTTAEEIPVEERALQYIARAADGSMRDALSLLDQCVAFHYGQTLTYDNVLEVLGAVDSTVFSNMLRAVLEKRTPDCIRILEEMVIQGRELGQFVTDFIWYLRNLLVLKSAEDAENMLEMSEDNLRMLKEEAALVDGETLMRFIRVFSDLSNQLRYASQKRVLIEIALIKLTKPQMEPDYDAILQRLNELESRINEGPSMTPEMLQSLAAVQAAAPSKGVGIATPADAEAVIPAERVVLPKAQYEDLMQIQSEWPKIVRSIGGAVPAAFRETQLEPSGEGSLCIVFQSTMNYEMGSRATVLRQIEDYVREHYQKEIYFKVRMRGRGEATNRIYLSDGEAEQAIHMEIDIED
jgi:DNA polymerase-3 subunit gamma/tau